MRLRRRDVLMAAAALATCPRAATAATDGLLDPAAMREDVAVLGRSYAALHPGLLRYQTQRGFEDRLAALTGACARPLTLGQFFLQLSRFLATIRCGHSYANFYNQNAAVQQQLFAGRDRLPFAFRWLAGEMVVTADPSGIGVAPGSVIELIDGRPARTVLAALLPLVRGDGGNDDKRRMLLSVQLDDEFETFDIFYPLVFGARDRHALRVRAPDGRRRTLTTAAIDLSERRAQRPPTPDPKSTVPLWTMRRTSRVALLTMPSWAVYDSAWDWKTWLATQLDAITGDGTTGLIVDLRANEGGLDCGDAILARLIDQPLPPAPGRRLVRYRAVPDALRPALRTWDKSFYDWSDRAHPLDARFFELRPEQPGDGAITPIAPRFRGKIAVLIGAQNSSATFNFASTMRRARLGTLVGEPTGGNRRGINGGAFFTVRLPASRLTVDLPLIATFPTEVQPDSGLLPDIAVPLTRAAIADGRDDALDAARRLVA